MKQEKRKGITRKVKTRREKTYMKIGQREKTIEEEEEEEEEEGEYDDEAEGDLQRGGGRR